MITISQKDINRINRILSLQGLQILQYQNSNEQMFMFTKRELDNLIYNVQMGVVSDLNGMWNTVGSVFSNTSLS